MAADTQRLRPPPLWLRIAITPVLFGGGCLLGLAALVSLPYLRLRRAWRNWRYARILRRMRRNPPIICL